MIVNPIHAGVVLYEELQNLDFLPMHQKRAEMVEPNGNKTGAKALEGVQKT